MTSTNRKFSELKAYPAYIIEYRSESAELTGLKDVISLVNICLQIDNVPVLRGDTVHVKLNGDGTGLLACSEPCVYHIDGYTYLLSK